MNNPWNAMFWKGTLEYCKPEEREFILEELRPKGEWIEHKTKGGTVIALTCPKCMKSPKNAVRSDFCPHCGADMRGENV